MTIEEARKTPMTNHHFSWWCIKMLGQPYWYGTCGYKATEDLLTRKAKQYPQHYTPERMARYRHDIQIGAVVSDCVGGSKCYGWTDGGIGVLEAIGTDKKITSKYGSNGCPDTSANGMFEYAKKQGMDWGTMDSMPEIVGLALRMDGHVGYYIGGGYAVEWKGFKYGCVKTQVKGRGWTHWYKLPFINYIEDAATTEEPAIITPTTVTLGSRQLRTGMTGRDVQELQETLIDLGFDLGDYGADGDYGGWTASAVKAFQRDHDLEIDGIYGNLTHAALMSAVADAQKAQEIEPEDVPVNTGLINEKAVVVVKDGCHANVRTGNGTNYAIITTVSDATIMDYVATSNNGWYAVVVGAQVGWISGKYTNLQMRVPKL